MARTCPRCRLLNPPTAKRCDCGYNFAARRDEDRDDERPEEQQPDVVSLGIGIGGLVFGGLFLIGGVITLLTMQKQGIRGGAQTVGFVCGAFLPALVTLPVGAFFLYRYCRR